MTVRKLTAAEAEALLTELADTRNCPNKCGCVFCREFERGVESGKHDAAITFQRALDDLKSAIRLASCDTRRNGEDATEIAAEFTSGAVPEGQTPNAQRHD